MEIAMQNELEERHSRQAFSNDYQLVNGIAMHLENPEHFHIPPSVIKRNVRPGQFVELRIDSPRFSVHESATDKCNCPSCHGQMSKPILRHEHPATLFPMAASNVSSKGWGEDFWVKVIKRSDNFLLGHVDNPLVEQRLHGVCLGDEIVFQEDNILAVHPIHRHELLMNMNQVDLQELIDCVQGKREPS